MTPDPEILSPQSQAALKTVTHISQWEKTGKFTRMHRQTNGAITVEVRLGQVLAEPYRMNLQGLKFVALASSQSIKANGIRTGALIKTKSLKVERPLLNQIADIS